MSNELTIVNQNFPTEKEIQSIQFLARTAHASGLYQGVGQEAKIIMVLLAARELGISPCMALNGGIWNIQGRIEISPRCMNSMIRRAGHSIKVVRSDDHICTLLGKRSDGDTFECTFSIEDAQKAGLASKDVWKKYTSDMLYNRCMSRLARRLFADVIGEAYIQGEVREAKEVEEQEKQLQQAECEDVTPVIPPKEDIEPPKEECITQEQCFKLMELQGQIDELCLSNMQKYMKDKLNISDLSDVPVSKYMLIYNAMNNNINSNKEKANA